MTIAPWYEQSRFSLIVITHSEGFAVPTVRVGKSRIQSGPGVMDPARGQEG
jgi:hypothetical protein